MSVQGIIFALTLLAVLMLCRACSPSNFGGSSSGGTDLYLHIGEIDYGGQLCASSNGFFKQPG